MESDAGQAGHGGQRDADSPQEVVGIKLNRSLFYRIMSEMEKTPAGKKLKGFSQHKGTSTLQHSRNVAVCSFYLAQKLGIEVDEVALARGAMLHDYYLYDRKGKDISGYRHIVHHPQDALENARKEFDLNKKEENIIRSHMWPLTLLHPPLCREAFLVQMADKYCAVREMASDSKKINPEVHTPWVRTMAARRARKLVRALSPSF